MMWVLVVLSMMAAPSYCTPPEFKEGMPIFFELVTEIAWYETKEECIKANDALGNKRKVNVTIECRQDNWKTLLQKGN